MAEVESYSGWAIVELMGHRRLAGHVSEERIAGAGFLRIDVPHRSDAGAVAGTQLYSPAAIFSLTPVSEELARQVAAESWETPMTLLQLPGGAGAGPWEDDEE